MKLLFDHNLSPRLVQSLADVYPGSVHVRDLRLHTAMDDLVWAYAAEHGFIIVSKDADFHQRSFLFGSPPRVVWIRLGNCSTNTIAVLLRSHVSDLEAFSHNEEATFLILG